MTSWPEPHDFDLPDTPLWERQHGETSRAYEGFRTYRDLPVSERSLHTAAERVGNSVRTVERWSVRWRWPERSEAWDDACHRIEDQERLEAIRSMHSLHRKAGRAATVTALQALGAIDPNSVPVGAIARLLELGTRLERSTLISSVEELQGIEAAEDEVYEDPWDRIAAELDPSSVQQDSQ
jgi:hypothetical protein